MEQLLEIEAEFEAAFARLRDRYQTILTELWDGAKAVDAGITAGLSPKSASSQVSQILKKPKVQEVLGLRAKILSQKARIDVDEINLERKKIAFAEAAPKIKKDGLLQVPPRISEKLLALRDLEDSHIKAQEIDIKKKRVCIEGRRIALTEVRLSADDSEAAAGAPPLVVIFLKTKCSPEEVEVLSDRPSVTLVFQPKQVKALKRLSDAQEVLFGGAAGGGKSHFLRMVAIIFAYHCPGIKVVLFRRVRDELIQNHVKASGGFNRLMAPFIKSGFVRFNKSELEYEFGNGSVIKLRYFNHDNDIDNIQGDEFHLVLIDEATQLREKWIREIRGRMRVIKVSLSKWLRRLLPGLVLPLLVAGSNPGWYSHKYWYEGFVKPCADDSIVISAPDDGNVSRAFVPARLDDNTALMVADPKYRDRLLGLGDDDRTKAMLDGDWTIREGAFFTTFDPAVHVIKPFRIPQTWRIYRAFDDGMSSPFYIGWFAQSDGCAVEVMRKRVGSDGRSIYAPETVVFPADTLVCVREWYGHEEGDGTAGLYMDPYAIGSRVLEIDQEIADQYGCAVYPGPADDAIETKSRISPTVTTRSRMEEAGCYWNLADKNKAGRVLGWRELIARLCAARPGDHLTKDQVSRWRMERPGFFVFETCDGLISDIEGAVRDPKNTDDVDKKGCRDHALDTARYMAVWIGSYTQEIKATGLF